MIGKNMTKISAIKLQILNGKMIFFVLLSSKNLKFAVSNSRKPTKATLNTRHNEKNHYAYGATGFTGSGRTRQAPNLL